ncbi:hypothetical protein K469DRAFT_687924 [Zopfia rhizophila CBS 207.26]|uniref:Uncharacterized protein n=1 Tax=Zopfia rhizophila CBS 207.26 TaxID=1314779 RepID=A0A6A6E3M1_9PEZI|nr:hypothetical protein K469DRAFT_687924 [Zopfia rhizophila CBS 207.26]
MPPSTIPHLLQVNDASPPIPNCLRPIKLHTSPLVKQPLSILKPPRPSKSPPHIQNPGISPDLMLSGAPTHPVILKWHGHPPRATSISPDTAYCPPGPVPRITRVSPSLTISLRRQDPSKLKTLRASSVKGPCVRILVRKLRPDDPQ